MATDQNYRRLIVFFLVYNNDIAIKSSSFKKAYPNLKALQIQNYNEISDIDIKFGHASLFRNRPTCFILTA